MMATTTTRNGSSFYARSASNSNSAHHARSNLDLVDVDPDDAKYKKRRRRSRRYSSISLPHMTGILLLLASLFTLWHYSRSALEVKNNQEDNQMKRHRAKRLFHQRYHDAPHHNHHRGSTTDTSPEDEIQVEQNLQAHEYEKLFYQNRKKPDDPSSNTRTIRQILQAWLNAVHQQMRNNVPAGQRWIRPYLLPPLPDDNNNSHGMQDYQRRQDDRGEKKFFRVERGERMKWQDEWERLQASGRPLGPAVDYTPRDKYHYPNVILDKPPTEYPQLKSLQTIMQEWHQDEDYNGTFQETLIHFNYSDPLERQAALRFRQAELPFKLYNVPEIDAASLKWTDEYVSEQYGVRNRNNEFHLFPFGKDTPPKASGMAQESVNNFFAFFVSEHWDVNRMGLAPVLVNQWPFARWAEHAKYADAVQLKADQPHFYWQSGVDREERYQDESRWTFISKDLPSFSSPTETFFVFHPQEQKGIQCRFGERGVVAATHYDSGRNMVAMITGAKRYILSPPRECSKLGIFTMRKSPIYRHSLLNFGHLKYMDDPGMSQEERTWLERAATSQAVETVLKKGEVLYIPSFWFHYIVSIQKSAQCNVRSGMDHIGTPEFGGHQDVLSCGPTEDDSSK